RGSPAARCWCRRRTGRRRRPRWSPRSSAASSRITARARTCSPPSPPPPSPLLSSPGAELGLFEVDEAALPEVARRVRPRVVALGNLFRDQLDRYGELEIVADRWREAVASLGSGTTGVVNADDPAVGGLWAT